MIAELHGAFRFDCPDCGRENFVRAIEGNIDEAALAADENQIEGHLEALEPEERDGMMEAQVLVQRILLVPRHVKCQHCSRSFPTTIPTEEPECPDEDDPSGAG